MPFFTILEIHLSAGPQSRLPCHIACKDTLYQQVTCAERLRSHSAKFAKVVRALRRMLGLWIASTTATRAYLLSMNGLTPTRCCLNGILLHLFIPLKQNRSVYRLSRAWRLWPCSDADRTTLSSLPLKRDKTVGTQEVEPITRSSSIGRVTPPRENLGPICPAVQEPAHKRLDHARNLLAEETRWDCGFARHRGQIRTE